MIHKLRLKLTLWFMLLVLLLYGADSVFGAWLFQKQLTLEIRSDLERICNTVLPEVTNKDGHVSLKDWDDASRARHVRALDCVQLFNADGKLLETYGMSGVPVLKNGRNSGVSSRGTLSMFSWNVRLADGSFLQAQVPSDQLDQALKQMTETKLVRMVLMALAVGLCGWWYSEKAVRPVGRSLRTLRTFVDDAGHELRTPVTVIEFGIETIEHDLGDSHPSGETIQMIKMASGRLKTLSSNLLMLAKMDHPEGQMRMTQVDFPAVAQNVAKELTEAASGKSIQLRLQTDSDASVMGDQDSLTRMLTNLVQNAINYTSDGGHVDISAKRIDEKVEIRVADDGIGIPSECQQYIFERFYRVEPSRTSVGSGLGLAIVKAVVEAHGGDIKVQSEPGKGSEFAVLIPTGRV